MVADLSKDKERRRDEQKVESERERGGEGREGREKRREWFDSGSPPAGGRAREGKRICLEGKEG